DLDRLDLGDVARLAHLRVVLGLGFGASLGLGLAGLLRLAGAALGLALGAGLRHSACLLMSGVVPAPAAVLAQLDSIRRVSPRLVRLIVAALALFAGKRHGDTDLSASHFS